jgi:2-oxoglutarate dehydrogenase E2 component (dihydrolipoamide succinyltransferase)
MTDVVMPQMGESIVEGTLTKWLKKPGDRVERDESLFEISTDKVDTEIPSPAAGVVSEILVEEGQTVGINTVVARIEESGGSGEDTGDKITGATPPEASGPLSPLVRKLAREHNLDLTQMKGTGAGGRITKQDVEAHLAQPAPPPPPPPPAAAPHTRIEPLSPMRIKIAEHMVLSKRTSAHVTTIHRIDMTKVAKMRERSKAEFQAAYGFSLTYLPFLTRAAAVALRHFPLLNASLDGSNIIYHNEINIGIAVALENGLIVPVVRSADEKNVAGLQRAIVDLATRARTRQLKPDEVQGGTFSITNFGSYGSLVGTPIINQPQVAIMGVGTVEKTPVVIDDAIAIRSICLLSLSFDHRLIDGALADQFMSKVKQVLEEWSEEVL